MSLPLRQLLTFGFATFLPGIAAAQNPAIDLDGDGMSDIWESIYAAESLLPGVDTDGDGRTNLQESIDGTNPFLAHSKLEAESIEVDVTANEAVLNWNGLAGKGYRFLESTDLATWSPTGTPLTVITDGPAAKTLSAGGAAATARFFDFESFDIDGDGDGLNAWEEKQLGFSDDPNTTAPDDYERAEAILTTPGCHNLGQPGPVTLPEAARFLTQATFGPNYEMIENVAAIGYEAWIDEQFLVPPGYHTSLNLTLGYDPNDPEIPYASPYIWTWWDRAMRSPDVLRQRVAFALSEIFVVSRKGIAVFEDLPWGQASYYDLLIDGSFGNYRDLLYAITNHPVMGHYLSHAKNRRSDSSINRFPDENYAREVMQLFSIGLYELNQDGTRKKDTEGNDIPTYSNEEITEFAKVFTGMTFNPQPVPGIPAYGDWDPGATIENEEDFVEIEEDFLNRPMFRFGPMHEPGIKRLLNGVTTNGGANNAGIETDLSAAVDNLFHHPNVGPFIGRLLIQRLVKSNPSPGYISRVATAFADNGEGVRGDMKAVVRAILLDQEARCAAGVANPAAGMLREPLVRYTHICRAFDLITSNGNFGGWWPWGTESMKQEPLGAPSVFNFFLPDHQPLGPVAEAGLVAPEFQITTATTTVGFANFWAEALSEGYPLYWEEEFPGPEQTLSLDLSDEIALIDDIPALVDRLDLILTRGALSPASRTILTNTLVAARDEADPDEFVRFAIYLFVNSPDFAVLR